MNIRLLKAKQIENGITDEELAKALHINIATLYRKKNGESDFYRREIQIIKEILNLTDEDLRRIFFADEVA